MASLFTKANARIVAVGLVLGGLMEYGLIRARFYDQLRTSRAAHLAEDWDAIRADDKARATVLEVEQRYRTIAKTREGKT